MLSGLGETRDPNPSQYFDGVKPEIEISGKRGWREEISTGKLRVSVWGIRESINICWSISNDDSVSPAMLVRTVSSCADAIVRNLTGDFGPPDSSSISSP
jgi:hypothetical protein